MAVGRRQQPNSAWITRDCSTQLAWMCRKPQGKNCYKLHNLEIRVWRVTEQGNMIKKYSPKSSSTMCMKFQAVSMAKESLIVFWPSKHFCLKSKELLVKMITTIIIHYTDMPKYRFYQKYPSLPILIQYAKSRNKDPFGQSKMF